MTHDIFPFVNVFVVTNILTRNYHEFLFYFKFVAIYYTIYVIKRKNFAYEAPIILVVLILSIINFYENDVTSKISSITLAQIF